MVFLGVLVGMLIIVVAGLAWFVKKEYPVIMEALEAAEKRIEFLEKRKALLAEAVAGQPTPKGVRPVIRRFSEDVEPLEVKA